MTMATYHLDQTQVVINVMTFCQAQHKISMFKQNRLWIKDECAHVDDINMLKGLEESDEKLDQSCLELMFFNNICRHC